MKKRILPALVCILMLLQTLFLLAPAASAVGVDAMDSSYVVDDLNRMGMDITKYKGDAGNNRIELLVFTEFGYKINGDFSEYGLYLYLWNPSGVKLEDSDLNSIQLSYGLRNGTSGYRKYGLDILSWSTGSGYEYVFYKVKIKDSRYIAQNLNKASRYYEVSGVEILRKGNTNATDYKLGGSFTFTGYHEGCNTNGFSTLWCNAEKLDVVELELHPVSYYTEKSSANGTTVFDEVFGVYFSVPDWVTKRYGNLDDEKLKGLESVKGVYKEAVTNGMLTDSDKMVSMFSYPSSFDNSYPFFCCLNRSVRPNPLSTYLIYDYFFGDTAIRYWNKDDVVLNQVSRFMYKNVFKRSKPKDGLSAAEFYDLYVGRGKWVTNRSDLINYTVSANDVGTVQQKYVFWKRFISGFKVNTEEIQFDMLQKISFAEALALNAEAVSEKFKVTEGDAENLKRFATDNQSGTTYVMHFAVRDCVVSEIDGAGTVDVLATSADSRFDWLNGEIGNSYYFEKTVFEDFDILELTYRNKENKMSVVPVSASPIDVTGGIPSPGASNPNAKPKEDKNGTGWWDLFNSLETWIKVVAVIAVFVLLFLVFRLFGGFLGFVGRIVTAPFRLLGKGISSGVKAGQSLRDERRERKAQREHDEDRADAKADRKRRQQYEDEDRERKKAVDSMSDADRDRRHRLEDLDRNNKELAELRADQDRRRRQYYEDEDRKRRKELDNQHDADRERRLLREIEDRDERKRRAVKQETKNDIRFGFEMDERSARAEKRNRENARNAYDGKFEDHSDS